MTPELKAKWLTALRSGQYAQGGGCFCRPASDGTKTYCCLGVLADIAGLHFVPQEPSDTPSGGGQPGMLLEEKDLVKEDGCGDGTILFSSEGLELFGLTEEKQSYLHKANDGTNVEQRKHSFAEIADWIEANL